MTTYGVDFAEPAVAADLESTDRTFRSRTDRASQLDRRLSLAMRQRRLRRPVAATERWWLKRAVDLFIAVGLLVTLSPLMAIIAVLVKLDSKGPVLFAHARIGQRGHKFKALKFRTMVSNANAMLAEYLEANPEMREEWEQTQKLRHDPRVTALGAFLRKTSLDELPQLWNVVRGEMSMVGPRPIVDEEIDKYGKVFPLYLEVKPGLTGLWQVSGRNDISYRQRVCLDAFYVRNWNLMLETYIIFRTPYIIAVKAGAY